MAKPRHIYEFGPFRLDTGARRLLREGTAVPLAPKSFDLLETLVESHGRALSQAELLAALWPDTQVEEGNLAFQVSVVRKALGPEAGSWVETVPRHGYRFGAPVIVQSVTEPTVPPAARGAVPESRRRFYLAFAALVLVAGAVAFTANRRGGVSAVSPTPLTSFPGDELAPSVSPNEKDVAFVWNGGARGNWDIYVKPSGIEDPLRITTSPEVDFNPEWSPDGRTLAFARLTNARLVDIMLKPYPDGPERRVAHARACFMTVAQFDKVLDWHPDGQHLIVAGAEPGGSCGLSAVSAVTGAVMHITEPPLPSMKDIAPAVSPDGRKVAFMRGSAWPVFMAHTLGLSSDLKAAGAPRPVTTEGRMEAWPAWLPDSDDIIFSRASTGDSTLLRAPASGTATPIPLLGITTAFFPSVSPGWGARLLEQASIEILAPPRRYSDRRRRASGDHRNCAVYVSAAITGIFAGREAYRLRIGTVGKPRDLDIGSRWDPHEATHPPRINRPVSTMVSRRNAYRVHRRAARAA